MITDLCFVTGHKTDSVALSWQQFLEKYSFDWFCTFTFRKPPHPENAFKAFRFFVNILNTDLYGKRWQKSGNGVHWLLAYEFHKSGVLHLHALIGDKNNLNDRARRLTYMDKWNDLQGYAKIEPIRDEKKVKEYCTKYIVKGGEIELSSNLKHYSEQIVLPVE